MPTLASVNGEAFEVVAAIRADILQENAFLPNAIHSVLIRQYASRLGFRNSDEELQLAFDELRYGRNLETVEATNQWIRETHQTLDSVQDAIDLILLKNKVKNSFSESQIQAHYAERQLDFEKAQLYSIRVESEGKARELLSQILEEGASFHQLAIEHSQDDSSRPLGGYIGNLTRAQMTPVVEAEVFKAKPGTVIGPVKTDRGWNLFLAAAIHKPTVKELTDDIRFALMEQLLNKLRSEAAISFPVLEEASGA